MAKKCLFKVTKRTDFFENPNGAAVPILFGNDSRLTSRILGPYPFKELAQVFQKYKMRHFYLKKKVTSLFCCACEAVDWFRSCLLGCFDASICEDNQSSAFSGSHLPRRSFRSHRQGSGFSSRLSPLCFCKIIIKKFLFILNVHLMFSMK